MRVINFFYENDESLAERLSAIKSEKNIFIQIFCGASLRKKALPLLSFISQNLPQAKVLLASSFAEMSDGEYKSNSISISISIFQKTNIKTLSFGNENPTNIADKIAISTTKQTKMVIIFCNGLQINSAILLESLTKQIPQVVIAGGNVSDDLHFGKCFVGSDKGIENIAVSVAILDSEVLQIYRDYIFEYNRIGLDMVVTHAENGVVYKINNQPIMDIYKRYLGKYISDTLPENGYQFPLTFFDGDLLVGRTVFGKTKEGGLIYGGDIKKGTKVKFGVASSLDIMTEMSKQLISLSSQNIDAFYVYSCVGRYLYFKDTILDYNVKMFNNIAPMAGFFTFGEFYHKGNKNYLLNNTNTFIALSEGTNEPKSNTIHELDAQPNTADTIIYGLRNLSSVSNSDYLEIMSIFKQYKDLLEKSLIVIYFDKNGNIIDANNLFLNIAKYAKSEIVGRKFGSIIAADSANNISDIWNAIKEKQIFSGIIKSKASDNSDFYTKTIIKPIFNKQNEIMLFVCSMDDVTNFEVNKQNLERSVSVLTETSLEKDIIIDNYNSLLDRSTAMVRIKNERFIEVNKSCEEMFGYDRQSMINKHVSLILKPNKDMSAIIGKIRKTLQEKGYEKLYMDCVDSNNKTIFVQVYLMGIKSHKSSTYDEAYGILHNVTELFQMQKELEDVQKEVLYAMGTISEGRSRETGNHIKRVAEFTYLLSNLYGLDKKTAELYKIASPMHDIGKLAIPDHILHKPGKLTDEEFVEMKTHAQKGYDMLCFSNRSILRTAAEIALTHHEWWNGNGYPNKLEGENIPICGRIVAVADVFDALSHDRCYKKAWPINEVVEHFVKNKGVQFDAKIVDLLLENIDEFLKIKERYADTFCELEGGGH
ncbi:HD domain-containing phosphohydrolase [Helicobacter sp. 23-1045]